MVIKYDSKKNLKDEIIKKKSQFYKLFEIKINSNLKNMNQSDKWKKMEDEIEKKYINLKNYQSKNK
jgi:hypothetical protein